MKHFYYKSRTILLTLAFGLASVSFFNNLSERWNDVPVNLPQTESESPIIVQPKNRRSPRYNPNLINQHKDLSLYEFEDYRSDKEDRKDFESRVRNYIWQHWRDKKRAYIILPFNGADTGNVAHIFIEPNENGQWHIGWIWEYLSDYDLEDSGTSDIRSVKFKKAKEYGYSYEAGVNYLSFLDKDRNEVESW